MLPFTLDDLDHHLIIGGTADGKRMLAKALIQDLVTRGRQLGHVFVMVNDDDFYDDDIPDTPFEEFERRLDELLEP
jgi:hypothetical protein